MKLFTKNTILLSEHKVCKSTKTNKLFVFIITFQLVYAHHKMVYSQGKLMPWIRRTPPIESLLIDQVLAVICFVVVDAIIV